MTLKKCPERGDFWEHFEHLGVNGAMWYQLGDLASKNVASLVNFGIIFLAKNVSRNLFSIEPSNLCTFR